MNETQRRQRGSGARNNPEAAAKQRAGLQLAGTAVGALLNPVGTLINNVLVDPAAKAIVESSKNSTGNTRRGQGGTDGRSVRSLRPAPSPAPTPSTLPRETPIEVLREKQNREIRQHNVNTKVDMREPAFAPTSPVPVSENGRDTAAPSDPNNTGAKGTTMGLSGGSISQEFDGAAFEAMLGRYGIQMTNPFANTPLPATPSGNNQQRLAGGAIKLTEKPLSADMGHSSQTGEQALPIDTDPSAENTAAVKAETGRTLDPSDTTTGSEELEIGQDGYYGGGMSDRSRAFLDYDGPGGSLMALRAANASQGIAKQGGQAFAVDAEGNYQKITDEGYEKRKSGEIGAQSLLSDYLAAVPEKAVEKVVAEGDTEAVEPGFFSQKGNEITESMERLSEQAGSSADEPKSDGFFGKLADKIRKGPTR